MEQCLKEQYGDNLLVLNNVMLEQKKIWVVEDQFCGNWMVGLKFGWSEWEESVMDSMLQVKSVVMQIFDGIVQNMVVMLIGSEQNWCSFICFVLFMMIEILFKQVMVGIVGSIGSVIGGVVGGGVFVLGGIVIQVVVVKFYFVIGGFMGIGGKYELVGIVYCGEFVFMKEAISRIGVGNFYWLMCGYVIGGYVGILGSMVDSWLQVFGMFEQNNYVVINNDGMNGQIGLVVLKVVYDMVCKGVCDEIQIQMCDGGLFFGGG